MGGEGGGGADKTIHFLNAGDILPNARISVF